MAERPPHHHVRAVADVFLPAAATAAMTPPILMVAGYGEGVTGPVVEVISAIAGAREVRDLGTCVGRHLVGWEDAGGIAIGATSEVRSLLWCARGREATQLEAILTLGRLAGLVEPTHVTMLWTPTTRGRGGARPAPAVRERVRRLAVAATPRAQVTVRCLGWDRSLTVDLADLASRFS